MKSVKKMVACLFFSVLLAITVVTEIPQTKNINMVEAAGKIRLNMKKVILIQGEKGQLKVLGTKKKIKWSSSNKKIVTVSAKGKIVAKKVGKAIITAKIGKKKYKSYIIVENPQLSKSNLTLQVGKNYLLKMRNTTQKVTWSCSDKSVISVNNGKIIGKQEGSAYVYAKVGGKTYVCKIKVKPVPVKVSYIGFESNEYTIYRNEKKKLGIIVQANGAINEKQFKYTISDESIVKYINGKFEGIKAGTCEVSVEYENIKAICVINVLKNKEDLTQEENEAYQNKVNAINKECDAIVVSAQKNITTLKRQGYYTGTTAEYNSEKKTLNADMRTLRMKISNLSGATDNQSKAEKARLERQLEQKQAELDRLEELHSNRVRIDNYQKTINDIENSRTKQLTKCKAEHEERLKEIDNLY